MKRIFDLVSWAISVMALVSLILSGAGESLTHTMQGITGGVLEYYKLTRDIFFGHLGYFLTVLVNFARNWLSFLPQAPWLTLSDPIKDIVTIGSLTIGALAFAGSSNREYRSARSQKIAAGEWQGGVGFSILHHFLSAFSFHLVRLALGAVGVFVVGFAENTIGL